MEKKLDYFDFAEADYNSLMKCKEFGLTGNMVCSQAQKTCERYLKFILEKFSNDEVDTDTMRAHALRKLRNKLSILVPDFTCDWSIVLKADGFYFTVSYPGDSAIMATDEDSEECFEAMIQCRKDVIAYVEKKAIENNNVVTKQTVALDVLEECRKVLDGE